MQMKSTRYAMMAAIVSLTISACGKSDSQKVTVGKEIFYVPANEVRFSDVDFLPSSQNDALRFTLKRQYGEVEVSVEDADVLCNLPGAKEPDYRSGVCDGGESKLGAASLRRVDVAKTEGTQWDYVDAKGFRVVSCYRQIKGSGLCVANGNFRGTVFSVHFEDKNISVLGKIAADVIATLSRWHVSKSN
jgi:hypothetical protein